MIIRYSPAFLVKFKKLDVRIRKRFKEKIITFLNNPLDEQLNNHSLKDEWEGYRSIDLTNDWRAIYEELQEGKELVVYFIAIGTHRGLYI